MGRIHSRRRRTVWKRLRVKKKERKTWTRTWMRVVKMKSRERMRLMRMLAITRVSMMTMRKVETIMTVTLIHMEVMTVITKRRSLTRRKRARNQVKSEKLNLTLI
jgi:hypothetical protein